MTGSRPDWVAVGRIIAERRRALGLPKNEAARRAGVSNTTWLHLERGANSNPTDATLVRIARVIEVRPEVLFQEAGRPAPDPAIGKPAPLVQGTPLPSNYPRDRTPYFLGRTDVLGSIARYLERWDGTVLPLVLTGSPGVGKTEAAARYMADHRDAYEQLGWVNVRTRETATADLRKLAREFGIEPPDDAHHDALVDAVGRKLVTEQRRLLLVIDDLDIGDLDRGRTVEKSLEKYVRPGSLVRVLMTSRRGAGWHQAMPFPIGPLQPQDAAEFLRRRTGSYLQGPADAEAGAAEDPAAALAAELGYLPRALDWAGAYVDRAGISLRSFLSLAREMRERDRLLDLLDNQGDQSRAASPGVWLPEPPPTGRRPAWDLLRILAFLASAPLDPGYLTRPDVALPESLSKLREQSDARAEYLFGSLITALRRDSLVVVDDDGLRVHPITQAAVRRSLDGERPTWASWALDLLLSVLPIPDGGPADHAACEHLRPHVQTAIRYAHLYGVAPTAAARLQLRTAEHLRLKGELDAAREDAEQAIRLLDGGDLPAEEVVSLRLTRALIHVDFGEFKDAHTQLTEALAASGAREVEPGTAELVEAHLAFIDAQLGLYDDASRRVDRVMGFLDRADRSPRTAAVTSAVALALKLLDEVERARKRFDEAMTLRRGLVGTRHHAFALDCYWLAGVELRAEQPHRSAYWFQLSLDIFKDLYGDDASHPRIGDCLRGLAAVNRLADSPQDALERLEEADAVYQGVYGFEHPVRKSLETTRELLRALQQHEIDRPAYGLDPSVRPGGIQPPPVSAVRRYAQQRLAIGNFTRGFDRAAEAVTALRIGIRLLDLGAFEDSLASLAMSVRLAEPRSLLALNAQMRLSQAKAQLVQTKPRPGQDDAQEDRQAKKARMEEARKEYQELVAVTKEILSERPRSSRARSESDRERQVRRFLKCAEQELQRLNPQGVSA